MTILFWRVDQRVEEEAVGKRRQDHEKVMDMNFLSPVKINVEPMLD
jgi:hypothetical protein